MEQSVVDGEFKNTEQAERNQNVCYEYAGYQVRLRFNGNKTLLQCMKNLIERKFEG